MSVVQGGRSYLEVRHDLDGLLEISNQYLAAFAALGFETTVVCLRGGRDPATAERIPAERVHILRQRRWDPFNIGALLAIARLCHRHRITHIVTHRYRPAFIVGLVTRFYRPRLVLAVIHGNRQFSRRGRRIAARLLFTKPWFRLVGVSESVRRDLLAALPARGEAGVITVPNCIDVERTEAQLLPRAAARARLGLDGEAFVFGSVGRLVAAKDQRTLIRAFHVACHRMDRAVLVIVGWGGLEPELRAEITRLGLGDRVVLTGRIDRAWRLMRGFDCFVITSVSEGFGLALIEAMVARRPVIATRIGSFSEILGDATSLPACGDHAAIADAMVESWRQPEPVRARIAEAGYERVRRHFSVDAFRARIAALVAEADRKGEASIGWRDKRVR